MEQSGFHGSDLHGSGSHGADLHVVVVSWVGMADRARRIANAVAGHADRLTVVYSNPAETVESGPGDWVQVPNAQFFGAKFAAALSRHDGGSLLLIHADAHHDDWPALIAAFRDARDRQPALGVWSPDFTHTGWPTSDVAITAVTGTTLVNVAQTDAIIIGLAPSVTARMMRLDYSRNNLGWGIGWAAVAHAYASGLLVLRDTALMVEHPVSRGYRSAEAQQQMDLFLTQLTEAERVQVLLLRSWHHMQKRGLRPNRLRRVLDRLRRVSIAMPVPQGRAVAARP